MACEGCDSGGNRGCAGGSSPCDDGIACSGTGCAQTVRLRARSRSSCAKCKQEAAVIAVGNQNEPVCKSCLHAGLLAKMKTALSCGGSILPTDNVLVGLSGGPCSRVALELLREIQQKAERDVGTERDRGLKVFGLGAVFVDERTALYLPPSEAKSGIDGVRSSFATGSCQNVYLHIVRLESVYEHHKADGISALDNRPNNLLDEGQNLIDAGEEKLLKLFGSVPDSTGKEDLLEYLRMQAIQKVAKEHGFTKVVLGLSTTRIAAKVIADTSKGRGYSLSADIQYFDGRWSVPVLLPLRDCALKQLAVFSSVSKFPTTFFRGFTTMAGPRTTINNLAHSFITTLQEENPSREQAIVRTATKLSKFSFNNVTEPRNMRRRRPQGSLKENVNLEDSFIKPDLLCSICRAPVGTAKPVNSTVKKMSNETSSDSRRKALDFRNACCPSCQCEILADDIEEGSVQYDFFPEDVREGPISAPVNTRDWMRSQIKSYLLPEDDVE